MTDERDRLIKLIEDHHRDWLEWPSDDLTLGEHLVDRLGLHAEEVADFTGGAEIRYVTKTFPPDLIKDASDAC